MAEKFKIGDIVQLKSGGPKMTINSADAMSPNVYVAWFVGSKREHARFHVDSIELAKDDPSKPLRNESHDRTEASVTRQ
jgi:uncharacterized protein YodC (DUF2158 family)